MKKYVAEIDGRMRVVTKTGRSACQLVPHTSVGSSLLGGSTVAGEVAFIEVEQTSRVGSGDFRHWVTPSNLYEVAGENTR